MGSPIGKKRNVKIFVLYLMQNIGYPMDYITINEISIHSDLIFYMDFADAFYEMVEDGLIEELPPEKEGGEALYRPTMKGICVAEELKSEILPSILDDALSGALRYLDFKKRKVTVHCQITKCPEGGYYIHCDMLEKKKKLLDVTLWADSENRALRMEEQFRSRPEVIYRGVTALLAGKVDYLFG